jgi:hypothetical protein
MGVSVMNPVGGGTLATATPQVMRLLPGARSAAEIALRYVEATPGVACALSGMNTLEQLEENVRIASQPTPMTARQQARMRERLDRISRTAGEFCTACGYCMPCPHGVDIPGNFKLMNRARFFGLSEWAGRQYARFRTHKEGDRSAAACRQCGSCEPKCPNKVPITRQLQEVAASFGGAGPA